MLKNFCFKTTKKITAENIAAWFPGQLTSSAHQSKYLSGAEVSSPGNKVDVLVYTIH